jgi:anti-repressor protein
MSNKNVLVGEAKNSSQPTQEVKIFSSEKFGEIRTMGDTTNPLFCLPDVCRALSVDISNVREKVRKGWCIKHPLQTNGGIQETTFVNESVLYDIIFSSRKAEAVEFRHWVTDEVLPMIRKTGAYLTKNTAEALASGDITAQREFIKMYLTTLDDLEKKNQMLQQATTKIEEDKPKVEFHDAVHDSTNLMSIQDFGKAVSIGEKTLFSALRDMGIFYYDKRTNLPYQEYINSGYFKVIEGTYKNKRTGETMTYLTTKITGKGQTWLTDKLNK